MKRATTCIGARRGIGTSPRRGKVSGRRAWIGTRSLRLASCSVTAHRRDACPVTDEPEEGRCGNAVAAAHVRMLRLAGRIRRDERGQGTVEYVGLAMAVGVLLLAVSSFLGGTRSRHRQRHHGRDQVGRAAGGGRGEVGDAGRAGVRSRPVPRTWTPEPATPYVRCESSNQGSGPAVMALGLGLPACNAAKHAASSSPPARRGHGVPTRQTVDGISTRVPLRLDVATRPGAGAGEACASDSRWARGRFRPEGTGAPRRGRSAHSRRPRRSSGSTSIRTAADREATSRHRLSGSAWGGWAGRSSAWARAPTRPCFGAHGRYFQVEVILGRHAGRLRHSSSLRSSSLRVRTLD